VNVKKNRCCVHSMRERTPRPCSACASRRLSRRGDRRLVGARFGRWREERFGRSRCLTLRYSLPLPVWVDPLAEHGGRNLSFGSAELGGGNPTCCISIHVFR